MMNVNISSKSTDIAHEIVSVVSDKLGRDIVLLDLREVSGFTDYFVITTVDSARQMNALVEDVEIAVKTMECNVYKKEGTSNGGWMLLDLSDIVIHVFQEETRSHYDIEKAWINVAVTIDGIIRTGRTTGNDEFNGVCKIAHCAADVISR